MGLATLIALYCWRAWYLRGWYIVNYGLGIFFLNLFIGFLSPQVSVLPLRALTLRPCHAPLTRVCASRLPD